MPNANCAIAQLARFALLAKLANYFAQRPPLGIIYQQRWSRGHKARGQGQGHKKKFKARDSLSEDRPFRGQEQERSRPRPRTKDTGASVLKKRSSRKFFRRSPKNTVFKKIFQANYKILTIQKIVLSSSRRQAIFEDLRLQGQGFQNVSSRPRTSSRTPPLFTNNMMD